jgi:DNA repair photolyase
MITKSDLIVRDLDLLQEIARANVLGVHITVTTLDTELARLLEPRAPRPDLRLNAVRKLADAGIMVGVNPNPIMPGITDSEAALDHLAKACRDAGAVTFGGGPLFLMPSAQQVFFPFLEREFPHLLPRYRELYARSAYLGKDYKEYIAAKVRRVRARHNLASGMIEYKPDVWVEEQGSLFE